ncbi:TPA_asm: hypothetical protein GF160_01470 [Listeria monocytogenes]|nr:hypothetical protein [Listeria monocytogenes]
MDNRWQRCSKQLILLKIGDVSPVEDEPRKTPWVFRGFCLRTEVQKNATSDKIKALTNMELN